MTLVSCWVLVLPSLFATPSLSYLDPNVRHAVRPIAGLLSKHYDTVQPPWSRWTRLSPPSSAALAGYGASHGYKEVFWRLAVNGVRAVGACQRYCSAPCPCGVVGSGANGDCERLRQHAFWECAIAQAVRNQVQRELGGALLQQWHLWLVDPPPSVCEMVWRVVVLATIWEMEQSRERLWSLVHTPPRHCLGRGLQCSKAFPKLPPRSGLPCMIFPGKISHSQQRAGMKLALIILSCLFASRSLAPVPSDCISPISIDGVLFQCFAWQALYSTCFRGIWFRFVWPRYAFCFALPCEFLYT
jgi:hypothetical protein